MSPEAPLVLLPGAFEAPATVTAIRDALARSRRVLSWRVADPAPGEPGFSLARAAEQVSEEMAVAGVPSATVCGLGLGAMTALQLAVDHPDRVGALVLLTQQVRLSPVLMSLPAAVLRLLPATAVQRLGAGREQLLALLDQVRPVDVRPLAPRVQARTVVVCGARDRVNRTASASLAGALPRGELRLLPGAGMGWLDRQPQLLVEVVTDVPG